MGDSRKRAVEMEDTEYWASDEGRQEAKRVVDYNRLGERLLNLRVGDLTVGELKTILNMETWVYDRCSVEKLETLRKLLP